MPISEDEYDSRQEFDQEERSHATMSKAELRKTNKPIMEKKRRARINQCLGELKDLILEAMKKDPSRHSKLEKADILEMTVRHLQAIQRRGLAVAAATDPEVLPRFRQGFAECAAEATRFLSRPPALPAPARVRLRQHLASCVAALHQPPPPTLPHDLNGNIRVGNVPLIPSRLPTGELALVLPANTQLPFSRPPPDIFPQKGHHSSAFQTVVRSANRPPSPASSVSSSDSLTSDRATPPQKTLKDVFPTPPSQASSTESSPETQKPVVSSTTISPENKTEANQESGRQKGSLWRQTDVRSPKHRSPPLIHSSVNVADDSEPKLALDYSMTPATGKRKMYPTGNSANLLNAASTLDTPYKYGKIACTRISSSQSPEETYSPPNTSERNNYRQNDRRENEPSTSGSQSSNDMWRPW